MALLTPVAHLLQGAGESIKVLFFQASAMQLPCVYYLGKRQANPDDA
jgi:hypothetical protein